MKDYGKAIYAFKRAKEVKEDYYPAYINMAKAYEGQGRKDLSMKEYKKIQEMASGEPKLRSFVRIAEERPTTLKK